MQSLITVILSLRGVISEPVRSLIARRFVNAILSAITDDDAKDRFIKIGAPHFLKACEVGNIMPFVPDDLTIEYTELANFCNRWMTVEAFREPGDEAWTSITANMNSLRVTMVAELQAIAAGMTLDEVVDTPSEEIS